MNEEQKKNQAALRKYIRENKKAQKEYANLPEVIAIQKEHDERIKQFKQDIEERRKKAIESWHPK